jgi:general stress protein 26
MATTPSVKLHELLESFGVAMLVTRTKEGELRARPMALAKADESGNLWFATDKHSAKVDEIHDDGQVAITMQDKTRYVSISGVASLRDDRAKLAELWKTEWKVWFPGGKDDPNITLLEVDGTAGEYWDNSGASGLKYLIEAGKALLSGTRPDNVDDDPKIHGKVNL